MDTTTSYDAIPYTNNPFHYTHPNALAVLPTLLGMNPAPVENCSVLELGCGLGGNLIPMAEQLPNSRFVGIDLSARQIEVGQETIRTLGMKNIELQPLSILDVDEKFGQFDYIICHGVYSWVPDVVADKILDICKHNLSPRGIAYVSYNTYPGWHVRGMVREMLRFHTRQFADPREKVQQARAFLSFLLKAAGGTRLYGGFLQLEADALNESTDTYLFHEHLEEVNQPVYFHQFAEKAAKRGLQYVGEVVHTPFPQQVSPEVVQTLQDISHDLINAEQYLDFVRNRIFRRTLLCHADVPLNRPPSPSIFQSMRISSKLTPKVPDGMSPFQAVEFTDEDGPSLKTNNPLMRTALCLMKSEYPRSFTVPELWEKTIAQLRQLRDSGVENYRLEQLVDPLMQCYLSNMVEVRNWDFPFAQEPGPRPKANALARYQAEFQSGEITNLRHRKMKLHELEVLILPFLDGTRDRTQVVDKMMEAVENGALKLRSDPDDPPTREMVQDFLRQNLEKALTRLGRGAYLTA